MTRLWLCLALVLAWLDLRVKTVKMDAEVIAA
jgi:hypothetical protein